MDLGAYWYQSLALVFKLDVDDLDRWENRLLVCVAGPRYTPERGIPGILRGSRESLHIDLCPALPRGSGIYQTRVSRSSKFLRG